MINHLKGSIRLSPYREASSFRSVEEIYFISWNTKLITVLFCYRVTVLQCYNVTVLLCYRVTVLQCYCVTVLLCYSVTMLPCYCVTVLLCYCVTVLPYYFATKNPQTVSMVMYSATFYTIIRFTVLLFLHLCILHPSDFFSFVLTCTLLNSFLNSLTDVTCSRKSPPLFLSPWWYFMERQNSWIARVIMLHLKTF